MKWLNPFNWFRAPRDDSRKAFAAGLLVAREEYVAGLLEDGIEAKRRGLEVTLEALSFAEQLAQASDPAKAAVIEAFRAGVVEQAKAVRRLMDQPLPEAASKAALDAPFDDAGSLETSSAAALPGAPQKALPSGNGTAPKGPTPAPVEPLSRSVTLPPVKRRRGRPRKYPRPEDNGTTGQEPKD